MFRKLDVTNKSINCGSNAGLTNKFGIPALASKALSMLSSLIGGIGAVFYMIFSILVKQANKQLASSISKFKATNFAKYISDSYTQRVGNSASVTTATKVTVDQEKFNNKDENQIKFVIKELFFCALLSSRRKIPRRNGNIAKNVEQEKYGKHKKRKNSSTEKTEAQLLALFPIRINQINKLDKVEPAFSEMLKAR